MIFQINKIQNIQKRNRVGSAFDKSRNYYYMSSDARGLYHVTADTAIADDK